LEICETRLSDSPYVELIWHAHSDSNQHYITIARKHWGMLIMHYQGRTSLALWGPMSKAGFIPYLDGVECICIHFKPGTFTSVFSTVRLVDKKLEMPKATDKSFWFNSSAWKFPSYENADTFVDWLVRDGAVMFDPTVEDVLKGRETDISSRSIQRRFLHAAGLTYNKMRQIERAEYAVSLLESGISIIDTVAQAGYFDQPHMTRWLKRLMGRTPSQISRQAESSIPSFFYKTQIDF
jgi:AraC-like DNA-binding protein